MSAVRFRLGSELRARWRPLLSLALIAGIGGGVALGAAAGARRTQSAYPDFLRETHAYDVTVGANDPTGTMSDAAQLATLRPIQTFPEVAEFSMLDLFRATVVSRAGKSLSFPDIFPLASEDGRLGTTLNRIKILAGRMPDPSDPTEAVTAPSVARSLGVKAGDGVELRFGSGKTATSVSVRVVGVGIMAGQVDPSVGGYIPALLMTPAFYRAHQQGRAGSGPALVIRLHGGAAQIPELEKEIRDRNIAASPNVIQSTQTLALRRTSRFDVVGLELFAALAGLAVLAIFGQLLARQIFLDSSDHRSLRALGMSRRQLQVLTLLRTGTIAAGSAVVAVGAAILLSPLAPLGPTRPFELHPGLRIDAPALGIGAGAITLLILGVGILPALRAPRESETAAEAHAVRTANALAQSSFPPVAVAGVRMALEQGRGSTAVPVKTAIAGTAVALAALTAALTFGGSLSHLVATPRLSGWNYDILVGDSPDSIQKIERSLAGNSSVTSMVGGSVPDLRVGGVHVTAFAFAPGPFGPSLIDGRAPERTSEIALGPRTARSIHASIGDRVPVTVLAGDYATPVNKRPYEMRVVGLVVTPQFFFSPTGPGYGAAVTLDMLKSFNPHMTGPDTLFIRLKPGARVVDTGNRIRSLSSTEPYVLGRSQSRDLENLHRISSLPQILAGVLALIAAGTLTHTLVTSVTRRRRDLAILKTLGFIRGQVLMAVVWQATTIVVIALAVGVPIGVVAGRWGWSAFIEQIGYVPEPIVPLLRVLLAIPITIALANLIASLPARAAARTQPAVALRRE